MSKSKSKPIWNDLTEEQILQLTNNLAEDIPGGNARDWAAVARYWRDEAEKRNHQMWADRQRVLSLGLTLMNDR